MTVFDEFSPKWQKWEKCDICDNPANSVLWAYTSEWKMMTFSWFLPKWWKSDKNDKNTKKRQKWWFESHADLSLCDRCVNLIKTWKSDQNDKNDENMLQKLILITMYSSTFYKNDIFWKTQNRAYLLCQWQDKWPPKHGFWPSKWPLRDTRIDLIE